LKEEKISFKCCELAKKPMEFDKSYLLKMLNFGELFSTIESSNEKCFAIPKCPNCGDLIRQLDLEALAYGEGNTVRQI